MSSCIFCDILQGKMPVSIVYQDPYAMALMDLYPMRPGHVLVIPREHAVYVQDLSAGMLDHLMAIGVAVINSQKQSNISCRGNNLFINDGPAANQHVPHVHLHVLPRSGGDLVPAVFSLGSRLINRFGAATRRRRLDRVALELQQFMPRQVDSGLGRAAIVAPAEPGA
jgi:diadenosine tetraphosphate (Ap4A) HIT family hydrolase